MILSGRGWYDVAVTIKDIAKVAGVSYSTVSRALNEVGVENSKKRKEIRKLAQEMGYVRNQAAVNLKTARSYTIGLYFSTISKMSSPFVLHDVLTGVYSIAGSKYSVVVKGIDMHEKGTLNPSLYDGIIVLTQRTEDGAFIEEVLEQKIPMVAICRPVFYEVPNVVTDEANAMKTAMDYLLDHGHRRIGVIEGAQNLDSTRFRHRGWRASMRAHGLDPDELPVEIGNYRYASGYQAARRLLDKNLTAILCFNDEMAFAAQAAILEAGKRVPEDISLIGFDNWDLSGYSTMKLTTVERSMSGIAKEGTRVLLRRMEEGVIDNRRIYLDNRLIVRDTVRDLCTEENQACMEDSKAV